MERYIYILPHGKETYPEEGRIFPCEMSVFIYQTTHRNTLESRNLGFSHQENIRFQTSLSGAGIAQSV